MNRPFVVDLYCGLGGWADGFLAEGWGIVGFDIERHDYGTGGYPTQLVLQDVLTLHGWQFRNASCIVASPPCQAYSYRAMPWKRAKALPPPSNELFDACFRIQREACEAAGRHIPLVVENVCGAQPWVGRAKAHYGSYYLWGDVEDVGGRVVCGRVGFGMASVRAANRTAVKIGGSGDEWWRAPLEAKRREAAAAIKSASVKTQQDGLGNYGARRAASAMIAKIPFELASYVARAFRSVQGGTK